MVSKPIPNFQTQFSQREEVANYDNIALNQQYIPFSGGKMFQSDSICDGRELFTPSEVGQSTFLTFWREYFFDFINTYETIYKYIRMVHTV